MASGGDQWDARKMFELYLHDYMVKKKMHKAAEIFKKEAKVCDNPVVDSPEGFLSEWWSIFHDVYNSRQNEAHEESSAQATQLIENHLPNVQLEMSQRNPEKLPMGAELDMMFGKPSASLLAAKISEEEHLRRAARGFDPNLELLDVNKTNLSKSDATTSSQQQKTHSKQCQQMVVRESRQSIVLGRTETRDPTLHGVPKAIVPRTAPHNPGFNEGVNPISLKGGSPSGCKDVEEDKHADENVETFLSQDEDNASIPFSILNLAENKGFSFGQVGCLHSSRSKVLCCHFSSKGNLLASAGHDKKVLIWNMNTFEIINTSEGHSHLISDVRFKPNSTILATSSFDRTVQIWDAAKPNKSSFKLLGHAEQVTSLDFNPWNVDLLCSCDSNDEIRMWNVSQSICSRVSKGATRQVRFQPRSGDLLATAVGNRINIIDVETDSLQFYLEGHVKEVRSICWDTGGKYIASVSEDSARVWSVTSGKCIHELHSDGNNFQSCTFHPGYLQLLVIGGYQTLQLWNPTESSKTVTVPAHAGFVAALAGSPQTGMIASVSHDQWVKVWK